MNRPSRLLFSLVSLSILAGCERAEVNRIPEDVFWREVSRKARQHRLDPGFLYAIAWAESSLNAHADNGKARGIMQMTEDAWNMVTDEPWSRAYNWRTNLEMGARYLALNRDFLVENGRFNYPLLAACYRHGRGRVQRTGFEISSFEEPTNLIYREIFAGHINPVPLPP